MVTPVKMPDLGTTVEQVKLIAWRKQEGEPVKRGEILAEVETDKAVSELEAIADGVLLRQVVPADSVIEAGTIIAYIGEGTIAEGLGEIQDAHPTVEIGSYPFFRSGKFGSSLVMRSTDDAANASAGFVRRPRWHRQEPGRCPR